MTRYKYYFRKPKSEIVKDFLYWLMISGAVVVAASSPYFGVNLWRSFRNRKDHKKERICSAFYQLKRRGCIEIKNRGRQIYISLTEKGKKEAGSLQIDALKIKKPKEWDKKWRILIFDIPQLKKIHREAFRGKLKELGFQPLQKSVWIHPFDCRDEIELLKDFFGLTEKEVRLIVSSDIGRINHLKEMFKLS
jgi:DNA-binding transcriptional regulator PaaX